MGQSKLADDALIAAEWIAQALSSSGYRADFSLDSLKEIDRFMDEHTEHGKAKPGGLLGQDLGSRLFAIGGYVGEVLRRCDGGHWIGNDADPRGEITLMFVLKNGSQIWPGMRVMKRLQSGAEDGIYAYGLGALEQDSTSHR